MHCALTSIKADMVFVVVCDFFFSHACAIVFQSPGPEVIKLFSYSTQLSRKFILLINVKMPTVVDILTFIIMINAISERHKAWNFFICRYFSVYEQLKFRAQLSWAGKKFNNLGACYLFLFCSVLPALVMKFCYILHRKFKQRHFQADDI